MIDSGYWNSHCVDKLNCAMTRGVIEIEISAVSFGLGIRSNREEGCLNYQK